MVWFIGHRTIGTYKNTLRLPSKGSRVELLVLFLATTMLSGVVPPLNPKT